MNARFSSWILTLAAAGLIGSASVYAGNGPGDGSCDNSGDGTCDGSGAASAQVQRHGGPADRMARMANRLGLSIEQQKAALDMFALQAQDREQLRSEILGAYGDELCALRDQHRDEFRAMLNDEQLALHDAMLQQHDRSRSEGRGGFGPLECPNDG
jgi:hypothetical protein